MAITNELRKRLIDKFSRLYRTKQGGIFTQTTRDKILTRKGISGKGMPKNQFWYRQRENVKTALIDLQLFVEASEKSDVDQIVTKESLEPIIGAFLLGEAVISDPPDKNRAETADMLIRLGFSYLEQKIGQSLTLSHERTMKEALDLSKYLLETIKGERYSRVDFAFR